MQRKREHICYKQRFLSTCLYNPLKLRTFETMLSLTVVASKCLYMHFYFNLACTNYYYTS